VSTRDTGPVAGAHQRTDLAWSRTGLAIAIVVLIVVRRLPQGSTAYPTLIVGLLAGGLATWSLGLWLAHRAIHANLTPWPTLGPRTLRLVTIGVVLIAGAAFVLALSPPP